MSGKTLTPEEIEQLVSGAQAGDEEAFSGLYDHFFEKVFRYTSFRVDPTHTEDVVGDIFLKVVRNLQRYKKKDAASFRSWVFSIAHNTVVDHYRKRREYLGSEDQEEFFANLPEENLPTPFQRTQKLQESEAIRKALEKLGGSHREILELRFFEDFTTEEIIKVTGKSAGNIRVIQLRALRQIEQHLKNI